MLILSAFKKNLSVIQLKIIVHTQKNISHIFLVVLLRKFFVLIINSVKKLLTNSKMSKMSKKRPVIFHNLRGYESHLIIKEVSKFDVKVSVIPNGLEKYMAFTINRNLVFIDSMQFMNSSLESLVINLSDHDFVCLSEEFSAKILKLVKQKGIYPYEYMDGLEKCFEDKLPNKCEFFSSLKDR